MDWLMGVCVGGGIESSTQDSRCNLWGKNVDKFCFDASGSLFFNCNGYKADPIEWNWCVDDRDSTRDWEGVRKQRDYLIFTSSEEWMPSLMFSSIHTNSSSSSSVCGTLYRPPSPSHWLCFFFIPKWIAFQMKVNRLALLYRSSHTKSTGTRKWWEIAEDLYIH